METMLVLLMLSGVPQLNGIYVFEDKPRNVTCWVIKDYTFFNSPTISNSIHCIPNEDLQHGN